MPRSWSIAILVGVTLASCGVTGDSPRALDLLSLVPGLPVQVARHLVSDTDVRLRAYAREFGSQDLRAAFGPFDRLPTGGSARSYDSTWTLVHPYWARLTHVLASEFGLLAYAGDLAHRDSLSPRERYDLRQAYDEFTQLVRADIAPNDPQIASLEQLAEWCTANGHAKLRCVVEGAVAERLATAGHTFDSNLHLRRAYALALSLGDYVQASQSLGRLAFAEASTAPDSMLPRLERALAISQAHGLVDQTARNYLFLANLAHREGRLVDERQLRELALRAWDDIEGSGQKVRSLTEMMTFYSRLDCWDEVERLLGRTGPLMDKLRTAQRHGEAASYELQIAVHRADALLATGRAEEAWRLLDAIDAPSFPKEDARGVAVLYDTRARAAEETDRPAAAREAVRLGLQYCDHTFLTLEKQSLRLENAHLLLAGNHADSARKELLAVDSSGVAEPLNPKTRIRLLVELARTTAAMGDLPSARAHIREAVDTLWAAARRSQASPEGYLAFDNPDQLNETYHSLCVSSPRQGYQTEFALRQWVRELGSGRKGRDAAGWNSAVHLVPPLQPGELHLLYGFIGDRLLRWTATPGRAVVDTLAGDLVEWRRRVLAIREALEAQAQGGGRSQLRAVARDLLPPRLRGASDCRRIYVTASGPLASLPFEALDLGEGEDYVPLGLRFEIAALRGSRASPGFAKGVSVLAAPLIAPAAARKMGLARLDEAAVEAAETRVLWPSAVVLGGAAATEPAVVDSWRGAGLIHVAAHLVREPEIPYYDYIPLAQDPSGRMDSTLEVADVRRQDLSRCELVVLATCGSGQPYVARRRVGPSMADAFLDAGAGSVLRTLRSVGDSTARRFVGEFLRCWKGNGHDAVAAAQFARRQLLMALPGGGAPSDWATWSVAVNLPCRREQAFIAHAARVNPPSSVTSTKRSPPSVAVSSARRSVSWPMVSPPSAIH